MSRPNQVHAATGPSVSERVLANVCTITKPYKTHSFIPIPSMKEPEIRSLPVTNRQGPVRKGSKGVSPKPIEGPRIAGLPIKPGVRVQVHKRHRNYPEDGLWEVSTVPRNAVAHGQHLDAKTHKYIKFSPLRDSTCKPMSGLHAISGVPSVHWVCGGSLV